MRLEAGASFGAAWRPQLEKQAATVLVGDVWMISQGLCSGRAAAFQNTTCLSDLLCTEQTRALAAQMYLE